LFSVVSVENLRKQWNKCHQKQFKSCFQKAKFMLGGNEDVEINSNNIENLQESR
jgi:hypothetical protein